MAINRFNDGDVLYAAPLNQLVDEINNNAEESASIKADLTEVNKELFITGWIPHAYSVNGTDFPNNGYINNQGVVVGATDTNWKNTDFIKIDEGTVIDCHLQLGLANVVCAIACYDNDKNFILDSSVLRGVDGFTVPNGVSFVRFCIASSYAFNNYFRIPSGAYIYTDDNISVIKSLNNRINLVMIGDSYGIQNLDGDITKFYWQYVKEALQLDNSKFHSQYRIGAGFGNNGYREQLQLLDESITDKESVTDIFLCGGWNDTNTSLDYGTDEAFLAGITAFNTYVKATYPNAKVTIGYISWASYANTAIHEQMALGIKRYKMACNMFGWRFIANCEYIMHDYTATNWQSDLTHPNNNGHKLLGEQLTTAFLSGCADVYYVSDSSDIVANGYANEIVGTVKSEVNNNATRIWSESANGLIAINGFVNNGITPSGATAYGIAKITTPYFRGLENFASVDVGCLVLANNKYYNGFARLSFNGADISARFYVPHDNAITWLGNVTNIYLNDFDLSIPTIRA